MLGGVITLHKEKEEGEDENKEEEANKEKKYKEEGYKMRLESFVFSQTANQQRNLRQSFHQMISTQEMPDN